VARRVTNADLADKLDALAARLSVVETEARIAKWVLRLIAGMVAAVGASFIGKLFSHGS
jgi:predicted oxidoreductase